MIKNRVAALPFSVLQLDIFLSAPVSLSFFCLFSPDLQLADPPAVSHFSHCCLLISSPYIIFFIAVSFSSLKGNMPCGQRKSVLWGGAQEGKAVTKVTGGKVRGRLIHRCCHSVCVWDSKCWSRCTGPVPPCVTPRGVSAVQQGCWQNRACRRRQKTSVIVFVCMQDRNEGEARRREGESWGWEGVYVEREKRGGDIFPQFSSQ